MTVWFGIESAPKDGTRILIFELGDVKWTGIQTAVWNKVYSRWETNPSEATEYDPEARNATHWMLLPDPPEG